MCRQQAVLAAHPAMTLMLNRMADEYEAKAKVVKETSCLLR